MAELAGACAPSETRSGTRGVVSVVTTLGDEEIFHDELVADADVAARRVVPMVAALGDEEILHDELLAEADVAVVTHLEQA